MKSPATKHDGDGKLQPLLCYPVVDIVLLKAILLPFRKAGHSAEKGV
jgi:hypothetical protein